MEKCSCKDCKDGFNEFLFKQLVCASWFIKEEEYSKAYRELGICIRLLQEDLYGNK